MTDFTKIDTETLTSSRTPASEKLELDEAVGATAFGVNLFTAQPGEQLPWGFHRHPDHEELFLVLEGTVVFETPETEYQVGADEAFFVPKNHRQRAHAVGDKPARVVAIGAPKTDDDTIIEEECSECGDLTRHQPVERTIDGDTVFVLQCTICDSERQIDGF